MLVWYDDFLVIAIQGSYVENNENTYTFSVHIIVCLLLLSRGTSAFIVLENRSFEIRGDWLMFAQFLI